MTRLPFAPLDAAICSAVSKLPTVKRERGSAYWLTAGEADYAPRLANLASPTDREAIYRARRTGSISATLADRLCVEMLGCHPSQVYGWAWWDCGCDEAVAS